MQWNWHHRVRQVVVGDGHCAAVTEDGALFTWETRREVIAEPDEPIQELGYGSYIHDFGVPYRVFALEGIRITSVAVGSAFTVAAAEDGAVYSFGFGDGRLGHGEGSTDDSVLLPKRIEALDGLHVVTVAAGVFHTLALTRCGRVYSWGPYGTDSVVHGLGSGSDDGSDSGDRDNDEYYCTPRLITALSSERVRAIAAGSYMSCAVTDAGGLYTWGDHCNLGHGDVFDLDRPTLVQGLQGIRVVGVSTDGSHTLALAADGSVFSFGAGAGLGISREGEADVAGAAPRSPRRIPELTCMVPR
jgi:alpha-tubulin suppressor-like RCC1 family protein